MWLNKEICYGQQNDWHKRITAERMNNRIYPGWFDDFNGPDMKRFIDRWTEHETDVGKSSKVPINPVITRENMTGESKGMVMAAICQAVAPSISAAS